jgi:L-threonylcarbamoyladenylate synthase
MRSPADVPGIGPMSTTEIEAFDACIAAGGVAVFPADTVYGLACDPDDAAAVDKLYALKGRPTGKPSAVMWFDAERALDALRELGPRTRATMMRLLPGAVTLLLPNPNRRFPLAGGEGLGVRVPDVPRLRGAQSVVLQSSANVAGGSDPRRIDEVPAEIRAGADLVIDAGELPGTPSTVVDLRRFEDTGEWAIVRAGAVRAEAVEEAVRAGTVSP